MPDRLIGIDASALTSGWKTPMYENGTSMPSARLTTHCAEICTRWKKNETVEAAISMQRSVQNGPRSTSTKRRMR